MKLEQIGDRLIYADWLDKNGRTEEAEFLRFVRMTGGEFRMSIVAQDDDNDYQESGWVVCKVRRGETDYGLVGVYGHCSCYDTWVDLCGGGISDYYGDDEVMEPQFAWIGSWEAVEWMARYGIDPKSLRPIDDNTYNRDHLESCWRQINAA